MMPTRYNVYDCVDKKKIVRTDVFHQSQEPIYGRGFMNWIKSFWQPPPLIRDADENDMIVLDSVYKCIHRDTNLGIRNGVENIDRMVICYDQEKSQIIRDKIELSK